MAINIGSSSIKDIYIGDTSVKAVYLGDNLVYSNESEPSTGINKAYNYFVFDTTKVNDTESSAARSIGFREYRAGDETAWDGLTDWGDGTVNNEMTHQYAKDGIYTVKTKWAINGATATAGDILYTGDMLIRCENINKNITSLDYFFSTCKNLTYINTNFDSSKVTSMNQTFIMCSSLTSLDLSGWNTSNMTKIYRVFDQCSELTSLNLSGWNTTCMTSGMDMFSSCEKLRSLDLSSWNVDNVTDMRYMFGYCYNLTSLNLSGWNMDNVTNTTKMFYLHSSNLTINKIIMTGCNDATKTKIQKALSAK